MILLLSGEGVIDLGGCDLSLPQCSNDLSGYFIYGVLTYIIDSIFNSKMGYSLQDMPDSIYYIDKSLLITNSKASSFGRNLNNMRGFKKAPETGYYSSNAKTLGLMALELQKQKECPVVAILFRDSDGTRSAANNDWQVKYDSMVQGFHSAHCETGVPMLAKPKSEAWLLAACKDNPYQHCHLLEEESGNDDSVNSLKDQLAAKIGGTHSSQTLVNWIQSIDYNYVTIAEQMPSFNAFYQRFIEVLHNCRN